MQIEQLIISADGHVNESSDMWARVPEPYRERVTPRIRPQGDGTVRMNFCETEVVVPEPVLTGTDDDTRSREFRTDPTGGSDLETRIRLQARDGVHAEVVFPNVLLALGNGADADLNFAVARAYNDWVHEVFSPLPERYVAAGLIPTDDVGRAVAEAGRCLKLGFRTLMIPCANAWLPYDRRVYDPFWALMAEAGVPVNFHVFTGNVFLGTDFATVSGMTTAEFDARAATAGASTNELESRVERLSTTVIGMAAGMAPIVHLTGGGVLERHPELRFVVTEAECGWLAWTLHAMDAMQQRRRLGLDTLSLPPSDYFRRQGAVTITDDPVALNNLAFTGTENIMWGNDYPHDEGTFPNSAPYRDRIRSIVTESEAHAIFAGNAARIYGMDLPALAAEAA